MYQAPSISARTEYFRWAHSLLCRTLWSHAGMSADWGGIERRCGHRRRRLNPRASPTSAKHCLSPRIISSGRGATSCRRCRCLRPSTTWCAFGSLEIDDVTSRMYFRSGNSERGIRDSTETRSAHTELNRYLRANCQTFPEIKQRRVGRRLGARHRSSRPRQYRRSRVSSAFLLVHRHAQSRSVTQPGSHEGPSPSEAA